MSMDMNREAKRLLAKQGADQPRGKQQPGQKKERRERTGPLQFLAEVRGELRKVAWPTKKEVVTSTIVVIIAVTTLTLLIFGFDQVANELVNFLYG